MRGVQADAGHHFRRLGAHPFADVGHLVRETNLHRQERIGGVLDHFRAGECGGDHGHLCEGGRTRQKDRRLKALRDQRLIEFAQHLERALRLCAQHDTVRIQRIGDRAALP